MIDIMCLAAAIYFEARSEPTDAQAAVAGVVLERVASERYPDTICGVVFQPRQFSAFDNGVPEVEEPKAFRVAISVASMVLDDPEGVVPILGATHYHTIHVSPYWADHYQYLGRSGAHLFYGPYD